jgi:Protein of unknown function (DUF3307)
MGLATTKIFSTHGPKFDILVSMNYFAIVLAHFIGDYLLQTHWMAIEKTSRLFPAILHGLTYTIPYLFVTQSVWALLVICITHILIDRYRLVKYLIWAKNQIAPKAHRFSPTETGYPDSTPPWLSTWLMIITDNLVHIVINIIAILIFG